MDVRVLDPDVTAVGVVEPLDDLLQGQRRLVAAQPGDGTHEKFPVVVAVRHEVQVLPDHDLVGQIRGVLESGGIWVRYTKRIGVRHQVSTRLFFWSLFYVLLILGGVYNALAW